MAAPPREKTPWENAPDLIYKGLIGQGGFGSVYKAYKELDRTTYAVKKISVEQFKLYHYRHCGDSVDGWISRLRTEVNAFAKLKNDHVVQYYSCWFEGPLAHIYRTGDISQVPSEPDFTSGAADTKENFFFIRMGYCNSDLRRWLKDKNSHEKRNIKNVHEIFKQILKGLRYIHGEGIIHRDLKPENIMILKTNQRSIQIQIGDFGLALLVEQGNQNGLTDSDTGGVGTRYYRSPEMDKRDNNNCNFKTDIFSAGCVFIELIDPSLNDDERRKGILSKIQCGKYQFPERTETGFPNEMDLIKMMTERDKNNRLGAQHALQYLKENVISDHEVRITNGLSLENTDVSTLSAEGPKRNVVIEFTNHLKVPLFGGKTFLEWGVAKYPAPLIIEKKTREVAVCYKVRGTATGTAGAMTYQFKDGNETVIFALIWSVPFNYIHASNWFGLKFITHSANNKNIYNDAFVDKTWETREVLDDRSFKYAWKNEVAIIIHNDNVITAMMSDFGRSIIKVAVQKIEGKDQRKLFD